MKRLFTIFMFFFATALFSQKVNYSGGVLKLNGENYGKNVKVEYDSFFESYLISYTNVNGYRVKERYESSKIHKTKLSNSFYLTIHGTGYSIVGLKKQK